MLFGISLGSFQDKLACNLGVTADHVDPASPHIHTDVLYYQNSYTAPISGLYEVMQGFYHQQYDAQTLSLLQSEYRISRYDHVEPCLTLLANTSPKPTRHRDFCHLHDMTATQHGKEGACAHLDIDFLDTGLYQKSGRPWRKLDVSVFETLSQALPELPKVLH